MAQVEYFADFTAMAAYTGAARTAIVQDVDRGGTFVYNGSITVADDVITFDANNAIGTGVWERQFNESSGVNVLWAGAKGNTVIAQAKINTDNTVSLVNPPAGLVFTLADGGKIVGIGNGRNVSGVFVNLEGFISAVDESTQKLTLSVTPAYLATPTGLGGSANTTGGSLLTGTYTYYVVALTQYGSSAASIPANVTTTTNTSKNLITWTAVTGATRYRVYRKLSSTAGTTNIGYYDVYSTTPSFEDVGATFDGIGEVPATNLVTIVYGRNDSTEIQKVLNLPYNVLFPANRKFLTTVGLTSNFSHRDIFAYGSTIVRSNSITLLRFNSGFTYADYDVQTDIGIYGGEWTAPFPVTNEGGNCFHFTECKNVTIADTHINGSPEGGIGFSHVIYATVNNNVIENCFRDGIYSDFSGFLNYTNNIIRNIKDDAMSIHDYGLPGTNPMPNPAPFDPLTRRLLYSAGLTQAGQSIVSGNIVQNAYKGFSSIGGDGISIYGNEFTQTVNAAVSCFNRAGQPAPGYYYELSGTRVKKISITDNICRDNCKPTVIMTKVYDDGVGGQKANAVAAISVLSLNLSNLYYPVDEQLIRSSNISIENNKIFTCGTNAVMAHQIDGLSVANNYAYNCAMVAPIDDAINIGLIYLLINNTNVSVLKNDAIDDRNSALKHKKCYSIQNTTGYTDIFYANVWSDNAAGEFTGLGKPNLYTTDAWKKVVKLATTASITLSGTPLIDGIAPLDKELVLVKNQSSASQNGIYMVRSGGQWTRTLDTSVGAQIHPVNVFVTAGNTQANTQWVCTNNTIPLVGTDPVNFGAMLKLGNTPVGNSSASTTVGLFLNRTTGMVEAGRSTLVRISEDILNETASALNFADWDIPGAGAADFMVCAYLNIKTNLPNPGTNKAVKMMVEFVDQYDSTGTYIAKYFYNMGGSTDSFNTAGYSAFPTIFLRARAGYKIKVSVVMSGTTGTLTYSAGARIIEL